MSNIVEIEKYKTSRREVLVGVKKEIIERLNVDLDVNQIDDEVSLFGSGLGLDSVDALDLTMGIEERFGVVIDEKDSSVFKSINALTDYIIFTKGAEND